jgi:hypothetical protein
MKTRLFLFLLPVLIIGCGPKTANPISEKDQEIIKVQIKEVVNTIIKGCEEANFDMAMGPWLNSPDFIYIMNGNILSYQDVVNGMKPMFDLLSNQKVTLISEKFSFIDKSTVLYTTNCKFLMNYKDGHSVLADPTAWFMLFRKIENSWKAVYGVESFLEKPFIDTKTTGDLKQAELLKKFIGNWEIPLGKDTSEFVTIKSLQDGKVLDVYAKWVTKGKMLFEGIGYWAYDVNLNKIDISIVLSTGEIMHDQGLFTSPNVMEFVNVNNSKLYIPGSKVKIEFTSSDELKESTIANINVPPAIWKRIKK